MPRHAGMDFPHISIWCDDCTQMEIQADMLHEIRRQNELKEAEIRERGWTEERPRPRPRPVYVPPEPIKPEVKGGMSIEPRKQ